MTDSNEELIVRIKDHGTDSDEDLARLTELVKDDEVAKEAVRKHFDKN